MKTELIGVTRVLAISGVTDFSFVDDEDRWKGSEIHRMIQMYDERRLEERTVPSELRGYLNAHKKFMWETGFVPQWIEQKLESKELRIRGRLDRAGLMKGKKTILDMKSGSIRAAVRLQMALYGHMLNPAIWWNRAAVQLRPDGEYSLKPFPLMSWSADLATALACVRVSQWKIEFGLV